MTQHKILLIIFSVVAIGLGTVSAWALIAAKEVKPAETPKPVVRVVQAMTVDRQPLVHEVVVYGTVEARTQTALVAEVTGRVIETHPSFVDGGFFGKGDVLIALDPATYEVGVASAEAQLAQAGAGLAREEAEADLARREWEQYGEGEAGPLTLRAPQLAQARASVRAAEVALSKARLDLDRTKVRAPYAGRILSRSVEDGQFVPAGSPIAVVYAVDFAEVRLPITPEEIAYLDLPLGGQIANDREAPRVTLSSEFGGRTHEWSARITRTEAQIDRRTRVLHAVAVVENPYRIAEPAADGGAAVPLLVGMFVKATIVGRQVEDVAIIPRLAWRDGRVGVIDDDSRLWFRPVETLRLTAREACIGTGLVDGDRICLTILDIEVDGMTVRVLDDHGEGR